MSIIPSIDMIVPLYYHDQKLFLILDKFFNSVKKHYPEINLIVVDGHSPLPLPPHWPVTTVNEENLGFTETVNRGLKLSTAEIIIVANDDLEFKKGDLDRFKEITYKEGIFSPRDTASGNLETFGAIWGMNRKTFKKMGYLNEKFRNYFSDKDYYDRAKKLGVPIVKWHDICVTHHESATMNLLDKKELFEQDQSKL